MKKYTRQSKYVVEPNDSLIGVILNHHSSARIEILNKSVKHVKNTPKIKKKLSGKNTKKIYLI